MKYLFAVVILLAACSKKVDTGTSGGSTASSSTTNTSSTTSTSSATTSFSNGSLDFTTTADAVDTAHKLHFGGLGYTKKGDTLFVKSGYNTGNIADYFFIMRVDTLAYPPKLRWIFFNNTYSNRQYNTNYAYPAYTSDTAQLGTGWARTRHIYLSWFTYSNNVIEASFRGKVVYLDKTMPSKDSVYNGHFRIPRKF